MTTRPRRLALPVLAGLALVAGPVRVAIAGSAASSSPGVTEERIAALEARVAELEAYLAGTGFGEDAATANGAQEELTLPVVVTRKHFQQQDPAHGHWEDFLDLEVEYDTSALKGPASALKGTLVFSDSFGEVRFELPTEVTDMIDPGHPLRQKDIRFEYNQFRDAHKWLQATEPKKMSVALKVATVMYRDGSTIEYR